RARAALLCSSVAIVAVCARVLAQPPTPAATTTTTTTSAPRSSTPADKGIPIPNPVVQSACGPCHKTDADQVMSRISFQRNTPEGWQDTVRRMASLNGLKIQPETARDVVRYLSNNLGLAPDEVKPGA